MSRVNQFLSSKVGATKFLTVGAGTTVKLIKGSGRTKFKFDVINPFLLDSTASSNSGNN